LNLRFLRPEGCGKTYQSGGENIATRDEFGISVGLAMECAVCAGLNAQRSIWLDMAAFMAAGGANVAPDWSAEIER
jgi:hypothetical protein